MLNFLNLKNNGYISAFLLTVAVYLLFAVPGLLRPGLEGLDGAHHVMDGVFFYDFFRDFFIHFPEIQPVDYIYDYYRQYPALGFLFWPPLFPAFEGGIMLMFGPNLQATWIALTLSGILLVYSIFQIIRRHLSPLESFLLMCCFLSFPILKSHLQLVMLEIPLLAMMSFSVYKYIQITEQPEVSARSLILLATLSALSLYIKQTAIIAYFALFLDFIFFHRHKTQWKNWILAGIVFFIVSLPLIIFTLTIGSINLEQSFGSGTKKVMSNYVGSERWSLDNWLYYPKAFPQNLSIIWAIPIFGSFIASLKSNIYRKRCFLWLTWIALFYIIFSYFDNKNTRFLVLILIPTFALLIECMRIIKESNTFIKFTHIRHKATLGIMFIFLSMNLVDYFQTPVKKISGIDGIIEKLNLDEIDGNISYTGNFRQPFVFYVRAEDSARKIHILQGEDILPKNANLEKLIGSTAKKFRVRLFIVEENSDPSSKELIKALDNNLKTSKLDTYAFMNRNTRIAVTVYQYKGKINQKMKEAPLQSKLVSKL